MSIVILLVSAVLVILGAMLAIPATFALALYGEARCSENVHRAIAWGVMLIVSGVIYFVVSVYLR